MTDLPNPCDAIWGYLTCSTTFRVGRGRIGDVDKKHPLGLSCPNCKDGLGLHPAGGDWVDVPEYQGDIPARLS